MKKYKPEHRPFSVIVDECMRRARRNVARAIEQSRKGLPWGYRRLNKYGKLDDCEELREEL